MGGVMMNRQLPLQAEALIRDVPHLIANLANLSALIWEETEDLNWAGFYLMQGGTLVLGPFQGRPACIEINVGKGVCGTAVKEDRTLCVKDVHSFAGHIACDSASNSELVVPVHAKGKVVGVLDLDSPSIARFGGEIQQIMEELVRVMEKEMETQLTALVDGKTSFAL